MRIHASSLTKYFLRAKALLNLSFEVESKRVAIVGQNGSGKSTLLSIIYGALKPTSGLLKVNGYEPYKHRERAAREMSFAFEKPYFDVNVKVRDVGAFLRDYGDSDCVEFFMDQLGVKSFQEKAIPDTSSGQKQLVQLLQAICRRSAVKLLDEPFSHLDVEKMGLIGDYIVERDLSVVMTTHVPEEAEWICDYFVVLNAGELAWHGSVDRLSEKGVFEVFLQGSVPSDLTLVRKLGYVAIVEASPFELLRLIEMGRIAGFKRLGVRKYF